MIDPSLTGTGVKLPNQDRRYTVTESKEMDYGLERHVVLLDRSKISEGKYAYRGRMLRRTTLDETFVGRWTKNENDARRKLGQAVKMQKEIYDRVK